MSEHSIFLVLIAIIVTDFSLERVLSFLNGKSAKKDIPQELNGIYDEEKYAKSQEYNQVNSRFGMLTASFSFLLLICALYFGWFGVLDKWLRGFSPLEPVTTLLFFGALFVISDVVGLPFSWYQTFVIEERFGFNKMTPKTFWLDKLKGYVLTLLIGGILLGALIYLVMFMGSDFWIYFWAIITVFILFINVFYTSLFLPLFNKLTPMEDGELKQSIEAYSEKVKFPLKNIFVMDGSKRSSKGNAFFSGLGRNKKVVLFDTLIDNHTTEELTAVFAHEVGHFKKKHIIYGTIISILSVGVMLYLLSLMIYNSEVSWAMGGDITAIHLNILAFGILYSPISRVLGIFGNIFSRKNEYEADEYAVKTFGGTPLIEGLKKMSSDHLSNLTPHPAYVFVNYSHPPLLQRVQAMQEKMNE
ncbi:MAG: peptidase M48 [Flammeovirgaceae bacterium]|nr:peptidase M48 [Flammeovirgaceae bacterium]MBE62364.1 peptidase M48 [Flammeovirgaceae bacterium]|tara:strand:- start:500 stop:1744 length:1245 start_codon:yes stop_codon:yes gene_type:complete